MKVGIVFSKSSGHMRRYIVPDYEGDDVTCHDQTLAEGEDIIFRDIDATGFGKTASNVPTGDGRHIHHVCIDHIEKHRGKKSHSGRCVVVHRTTGEVLQIVIACPDLYQRHHEKPHPISKHKTAHDPIGHPVHAHEEANVGWVMQNGVLVNPTAKPSKALRRQRGTKP